MGALTTQQLTEFLAVVAHQPDGPAVQRAAVECAAPAFRAEAAAIVCGSAVTASVGFPAARVPVRRLVDAATGRRTVVDVPGVGRCGVAVAAIGGAVKGHLIIARFGGGFTDEEMSLVRGMAGVVEVTLHARDTLEAERRQADENGRLVDILRERQRLLEQLGSIQRAIAHRAPLPQILDAITAGAREALDVGMVALNLIEADDPGVATTRSSCGVAPDARAAMVRVPLATAGVTGQAIRYDELAHVTRYAESEISVPELARAGLQVAMAVPVHENGSVIGALVVGSHDPDREWDKHDQDTLKAFAEHAGQAVTDAKTLAAMHHAINDSLTGLVSRAPFMTRLETACAAGGGHAALVVGLDRFKAVNDSFGPGAGNRVLVGAADRIRGCLRSGDVAARLGGDTFAVLMPNARDIREVEPVAQRILQALRDPFPLDGNQAYVSASIGIAFGVGQDDAQQDAQELMLHADLAMSEAKRRGKDRSETFRPELLSALHAGRDLELDLHRSVIQDEFTVRYQPIVHLLTGDIIGLEALVRWQHPTRGLIGPLDFIPLAEETGMIVPIGEWVLREACRQAAWWNARRQATAGAGARPLSISVNLSAVQLDRPDLPDIVGDALAQSGLPAGFLVLELTESLLVDHTGATARRLKDLKALGVRLAIDDFGTGYSSLAYLRQFPVDIIKIDKSFVDDVGDVPAASALTMSIIQLGRALKLTTIAEGIEYATQLDQLTDGDCEHGQGYYFAEPLDETAMADLLFPLQD